MNNYDFRKRSNKRRRNPDELTIPEADRNELDEAA